MLSCEVSSDRSAPTFLPQSVNRPSDEEEQSPGRTSNRSDFSPYLTGWAGAFTSWCPCALAPTGKDRLKVQFSIAVACVLHAKPTTIATRIAFFICPLHCASQQPARMVSGRCSHSQWMRETPPIRQARGATPRRVRLFYSAGDPTERVPLRMTAGTRLGRTETACQATREA